jgi:hypothetical protein
MVLPIIMNVKSIPGMSARVFMLASVASWLRPMSMDEFSSRVSNSAPAN